MTNKLSPKDVAPEFSLVDHNGNRVSLSDYAGQKVIVYFYPKAFTPGCTTQACDFRDNLQRFTAEGFAVIGISPDSPHALERFSTTENLPFPLLSDADHAVARAWGAWGEKKNYGRTHEGLIRSTFVINPEGVIEIAQYNVRAKGHVAKLRRDLGLGD